MEVTHASLLSDTSLYYAISDVRTCHFVHTDLLCIDHIHDDTALDITGEHTTSAEWDATHPHLEHLGEPGLDLQACQTELCSEHAVHVHQRCLGCCWSRRLCLVQPSSEA